MKPRRNIYPAFRFAALVITAVLFALNARPLAHAVAGQWPVLLALLAFFCVLLALGAPFIAFPQFGHRDASEGQLTIDLPMYALTFAVFGWAVTALLAFLAYALALGTGRQFTPRERLLIAATRVPFWALVGAAAAALHPPLLEPGLRGTAAFIAFNFAWAWAFVVLWFDPLTAVRTGRPLLRLWSIHLTDTTLWAVTLAQIVWAAGSLAIYERAGAWLAIASFVPLVLLALALRALHHERLAAHRMSLARDAVWNMLRARDPAAQITSLLSSVHGDAPSETLQIYARTRGAEPGAPLATAGPWPSEDRFALIRRALLELHAYNKDTVTVRDDESVVTAYGIRSERLLGSLVVHRPASVVSRIPPRRYASVAQELAPLLRDVRTVEAARDAASLDSLTGLLNRASIMHLLREQLTHVAPGMGCAILLIDVDNFKDVNDRMGHLAGDRCLRSVSETIAQQIRPGDRAGRIGGEEFVVLIPVGAESAAKAAAERLRIAIEQCGNLHADGSPVTVSIGVAIATVADTPETLIGRADRALYQAKHAGRNRVIEIA